MNKVELLAPAGDLSCLKTAINVGADAVYFGAQAFSARAYAKNFSPKDIREGIAYAHHYGSKAYCAFNTILFNDELAEALATVYDLYDMGIDALIIQDLGLAELLRSELPELALHGSTQMVIHNPEGARELADLGFERVVLARECGVQDIQAIHAATPIELEVFIHGALCMGYSGNCLMSSFCGGRSGNRGACAQPCRQMYRLIDDKNGLLSEGHLLSMKDLCTLPQIPQLLELGITSLKIEGRMKKEAYIASTVGAYRKQIDACLAHKPLNKKQLNAEIDSMAQIYNRGGFTQGYIGQADKQDLLSTKLANHKGIPLGHVKSVQSGEMIVNLQVPVALGDGYVLLDTDDNVLSGGYINALKSSGKPVREARVGQTVSIPLQLKKIPTGPVKLFKSYDNSLVKELARREKLLPPRKSVLDIYLFANIGENLTAQVMISDQEMPITVEDDYIVQEATGKALELDVIRQQMDRLGGTRFSLGAVEVEADGDIFIPVSVLNRLRRAAVAACSEVASSEPKRGQETFMDGAFAYLDAIAPQIKLWPKPKLSVAVGTPGQAHLAIQNGADHIIIKCSALPGAFKWQAENIQSLLDQGCELSAQEGPIVMQAHQSESDWRLRQLAQWGVQTCYISNISQSRMAQVYDMIKGDYPLNITNDTDVHFWMQRGLSALTLSPELSADQINDLSAVGNIPLEIIVAGRYPLLQSAYGDLAPQSLAETDARPQLKQGSRALFPVSENSYGDLLVLNGRLLSLYEHINLLSSLSLDAWRIEGAYLSDTDLSDLVRVFANALNQYDAGKSIYNPTDAALLSALTQEAPADEQFMRGVFQ